MQFELKEISLKDIEEVHALLVMCGENMYKKLGLTHWYPYPTLDQFKKNVAAKTLYGVFTNNSAVATFNLTNEPRTYYADNLWLQKGKALYVGNLGITPHLQGSGLGKWCMAQIEKIGIASNYDLIRFDALKAHPWLKSFYEKLGYIACESVKNNGLELVCFEKNLKRL